MARPTLTRSLRRRQEGRRDGAARIAGIMGAKRTPNSSRSVIPSASPRSRSTSRRTRRCPASLCARKRRCFGPTGVEMEALTAVTVACLTIYDMAKAIDRGMSIEGVRLSRSAAANLATGARRESRGKSDEGMITVEEALTRVLASAERRSRRNRSRLKRLRPRACPRPYRAAHPAAVCQFRDGRLRHARGRRGVGACDAEGGRRSPRRGAPSRARSVRARRCASSPARRCPAGADAIVVQEDVARRATASRFGRRAAGDNLRQAGMDFSRGRAAYLRRAATGAARRRAGGGGEPHRRLQFAAAPRVAILATGDELVAPGETLGPAQIVASNNFAVAGSSRPRAASRSISASPSTNGRAGGGHPRRARREADVLVTLGGASVGDYDLVQKALVGVGMELGFWQIAMRPGKPLMHGQLGACACSACRAIRPRPIVCAVLFLRPLCAPCTASRPGADPEPSRRASPSTCRRTACGRTTCAAR